MKRLSRVCAACRKRQSRRVAFRFSFGWHTGGVTRKRRESVQLSGLTGRPPVICTWLCLSLCGFFQMGRMSRFTVGKRVRSVRDCIIATFPQKLAGVKFGDGIEMGGTGQEDHLSILDEGCRQKLWDQYAGTTPTLDPAGRAPEFVGRPNDNALNFYPPTCPQMLSPNLQNSVGAPQIRFKHDGAAFRRTTEL